MTGTIELRTDLSQLGGNELVVINHLLIAEWTTRRQPRNKQLPAAGAECRRVCRVDLPERCNLALLDESDSLQNQLRRGPIGRAYLVVRTPFRWRPLLVEGLVVVILRCGTVASRHCHGKQRREFL